MKNPKYNLQFEIGQFTDVTVLVDNKRENHVKSLINEDAFDIILAVIENISDSFFVHFYVREKQETDKLIDIKVTDYVNSPLENGFTILKSEKCETLDQALIEVADSKKYILNLV